MVARICRFSIILIASVTLLTIAACATVPKETVELSYTVGQDIEQVHLSYKSLIRDHFQNLRAQVLSFLEDRWIPVYLNDFIVNGELLKYCQDRDPKEAFEGVSVWVETAIEEIDRKKKELLNPIDQDEKVLLESVDEAFARVLRANAAITAHLNSIRKVQEVQDDALQALKLKDLRDTINHQMVVASQKTEKAMDEIQKQANSLEKIERKLKK